MRAAEPTRFFPIYKLGGEFELLSPPIALLCVIGVACGTTTPPSVSRGGQTAVATASASHTVQLNLLFVHGMSGCDSERLVTGQGLERFEQAVDAQLPERIAQWEARHPGTQVVSRTDRVNLYTAAASPFAPPGANPLHMDDWTVGTDGCTATRQGEPCTTAFEWRYRLAQEIKRLFPKDAKNLILVGHSTGGRTIYEVASNTGPDGVGTYDWGVQDKIAAAISVHGMVDQLGGAPYSVIGPFDFETTCKASNFFYGGTCGAGSGWCEYAGRVAALDSADWVAKNKHALALISTASCSPSLWAGYNDGALPFDAQGSAWEPGMSLTPTAGDTWRPAHGTVYGRFCHSDLTAQTVGPRGDAVSAATTSLLDYLFVSAPDVSAQGSMETGQVGFGQSFASDLLGGACREGEQSSGMEALGVCHHPGGGDHAVSGSELQATSETRDCSGTLNWTQFHDARDSHAATLAWEALSQNMDGLVSSLPADP